MFAWYEHALMAVFLLRLMIAKKETKENIMQLITRVQINYGTNECMRFVVQCSCADDFCI